MPGLILVGGLAGDSCLRVYVHLSRRRLRMSARKNYSISVIHTERLPTCLLCLSLSCLSFITVVGRHLFLFLSLSASLVLVWLLHSKVVQLCLVPHPHSPRRGSSFLVFSLFRRENLSPCSLSASQFSRFFPRLSSPAFLLVVRVFLRCV